jgi:phosphatidylinositol alpha 1,6-mannosyltransferase
MSCSLPAIVSANAGSADAVREGVTGFVVPACDTQAIVEKLELLYKHPELRDEMGRQAQLSVQPRTWETYGRQIKNVFEALLQCKA